VLEGFTRSALVVRFRPEARGDAEAIASLLVTAPNGEKIPLGQLAELVSEEGPAEVSRENGQRRIAVEVNVRGRDIGSFVAEAQQAVESVKLRPGYIAEWGGTFEHLESGRARLMVAVPLTFALILFLLFTTFNSLSHALLVFTGIPFAVTGGILALLLRGMPFSMSAGVGFIAVTGVAVLNGVVMITFINVLKCSGHLRPLSLGGSSPQQPSLFSSSRSSIWSGNGVRRPAAYRPEGRSAREGVCSFRGSRGRRTGRA
jgi:cobalt-zinc-cadmium resistance protein CzcA